MRLLSTTRKLIQQVLTFPFRFAKSLRGGSVRSRSRRSSLAKRTRRTESNSDLDPEACSLLGESGQVKGESSFNKGKMSLCCCAGDKQFQNVLLLSGSFMLVFTAFQTMGNIEVSWKFWKIWKTLLKLFFMFAENRANKHTRWYAGIRRRRIHLFGHHLRGLFHIKLARSFNSRHFLGQMVNDFRSCVIHSFHCQLSLSANLALVRNVGHTGFRGSDHLDSTRKLLDPLLEWDDNVEEFGNVLGNFTEQVWNSIWSKSGSRRMC